jgi:rhodanese-related sulfurtransferase
MSLPTIKPGEARRRVENGSAVLVDIREPLEQAREAIPGAASAPLSAFKKDCFVSRDTRSPAIIFHCQSGKRTADNAETLSGCGAKEIYLLEGGLMGWKAAGFQTRIDRSKPIELQRQVQIAAGALVLASLILSSLVSVWFLTLAAFVGTGLVFAGVSGWCGMARLLSAMPWNRATT